MPEGHSVHRIARQFRANFVGRAVTASSPQGRFVDGASRVSGRVMTSAIAVGKQMFLEFDNGDWIRVHLGIYGAWDFAGDIEADATIASANGRMGQTNQRGTFLEDRADAAASSPPVFDGAGENSLTSIGAPRKTRLRMGERTTTGRVASDETATPDQEGAFPPDPVGAVRLRLLTDTVCADLRGPTVCEVLEQAQVDAVIARLGPDPQHDASSEAEARFVTAITKRSVPIAQALMDQNVVAGIGNVYRAEMLFRAGIDPYTPANKLREDQVVSLWHDWVALLAVGVETGQMMTRDGLRPREWRAAMASRDERHWVYKREGLPCRHCGTHIRVAELATRKLYWCPTCQV